MPTPDEDDPDPEGWAGTVTDEQWLNRACAVAAVLGATLTLLGWLATARWHLNRTARRHRP